MILPVYKTLIFGVTMDNIIQFHLLQKKSKTQMIFMKVDLRFQKRTLRDVILLLHLYVSKKKIKHGYVKIN